MAGRPEPSAAPGGDSPRYFLVMDFEATCERDDRSWPNEIIEFPAVLLCATTLEAVSEFRAFVRPTERPQLTAFCTELTGIRQADVDGADTLDRVLFRFGQWLAPHIRGDPHAALPVTCGDWDLQTMLPRESKRKGLERPAALCRWCNIKVAFQQATGDRGRGMADMLRVLGLPLVGRHHSGIDDARNISTILVALARRFGLHVAQTGATKSKPPPACAPAPAAAHGAANGAASASGAGATEHLEQRLQKKLQQMEALERKRQEGQLLNDGQVQKVARIPEVRQQLAELAAQRRGPGGG